LFFFYLSCNQNGKWVILWTLWIERNDAAFNNIYWHPNKLLQRVWLGIVDYSRVEWDQVIRRRRSDRIDETLATHFVQCWCRNKVFAEMIDGVPRWVFAGLVMVSCLKFTERARGVPPPLSLLLFILCSFCLFFPQAICGWGLYFSSCNKGPPLFVSKKIKMENGLRKSTMLCYCSKLTLWLPNHQASYVSFKLQLCV